MPVDFGQIQEGDSFYLRKGYVGPDDESSGQHPEHWVRVGLPIDTGENHFTNLTLQISDAKLHELANFEPRETPVDFSGRARVGGRIFKLTVGYTDPASGVDG